MRPYNSGMKDMERVIEQYVSAEHARRNEELAIRLAAGRSFEELLAELSALKGLNVEERAAAA